jgi:hypothetical protein
MLPLDKFLANVSHINVNSCREVDDLLKDCKLKYRQGKSFIDVLDVLNKKRQPSITAGLFPFVQTVWYGTPKTYDQILAEKACKLDKVFIIDWSALYGKVVPFLKFI